MDEDLKVDLTGMESRNMSRLDSRFDVFEDRLKLAIRDAAERLENKLVDEFSKLARMSDMRTRQALTNVLEFNDRLTAIEDRVSSLERRPL